MATYRNPWSDQRNPQDYHTDAKPICHAGCEIYHVAPQQWDVVKAGACISQRAGLDGAKLAADAVSDLLTPTFEDVRVRMMAMRGRL